MKQMKHYLLEPKIFNKIKPNLDGWIFWREKDNLIEVKTWHSEIQTFLDKIE